MSRPSRHPDPQAPLPGMEPPAPVKRFETVMVAEMPKRWECGCGKVSFAPRCWNCNAPKPVAVVTQQCSGFCAPGEPCSITADGECDAAAEGGGE